MSYLWSFQSFDAERLVSLFADPQGAALARLLEVVESDVDDPQDVEAATSLARRFVAAGLSYEGLDRRESRAADDMVALIFSPEGFAEDLGVAYLSDEGMHPSDIEELIARNPLVAVLPALVRGRRAGQEESTQCEYCVLSPAEVASAIEEVGRAIDSPSPWSTEWAPTNARDFLLQPLIAAGDRWVYAQLG